MTHVVNYPLTLLYDGACPICALEMDNFRERDNAQNPVRKLMFVDIAQPGFDPAPYGATLPDMQALIHAVRPDGSLVVGVPALRLAYQAVGMGAWAAPTGWPMLAPVFDWAYSRFARNRYRFSGAVMPFIAHIAARRAVKRARACVDGACVLVPPASGKFMQKGPTAPIDTAQAAIKKEAICSIHPERSVL